MIYKERVQFVRDTINKKGKPTNSVRVTGLSVTSKFENKEYLILVSEEDFTELENKVQTQEEEIQNLKTQLKEANLKLEKLENLPPEVIREPPKYADRVISLQEEINNRNQLLFNTQNTINSIFTEVNKNVNEANDDTKGNIIQLISDLQNQANNIIDFKDDIEKQAKDINDEFKKVGWLEWIRNKNKVNIVLDMDKLTKLEAELVEFTSRDITELANTVITPVEITTENLDLQELYISTSTEDDDNEIILKEAEGNDNGNGN